MNERGAQPDAEFERARSESDQDSAPPQPFRFEPNASGHRHSDSGVEADAQHGAEHTEEAGLEPRPADLQGIATAYSRRARRALGSTEHGANAGVPTGSASTNAAQESTGFRVRDFRPDANAHPHAAIGTPADVPRQPEPMRQLPQWSPPAADREGELSYFTQAAPPPSHQVAPPPPPPVNRVPAEFAAPPRPMTRRQLRELEVSQGIRPQADDAPAEQAEVSPAAPTIASSMPAPVPEVAASPEPPMPPVVRLAPPIAMPPAPTPSASALAAAPPPALVSPEPIVFTDPSGAASPGAPASVEASPRSVAAPVPVVAPAPAPSADSVAARRGIDFAPEVYTASIEQWAGPAAAGNDQGGASFVRTLGTHTGALTTSALVIPSIPQASDITRPFSSTGEILVTGSIDLPRTLGTTGAHPARFDHSDIDALFAAEDHEFAPADSAPVRAIRAVSTHTSTHGVISAKKPASNRLPMMMAVTAGILAVGVAALFAAGMIFGYF